MILSTAIWILSYFTGSAQVQFSNDVTWRQVLVKAKAEHKAIFVDCYGTWCAPCKWMDAHTYQDKNVGEVYNRDFICIKLQMDKTANDDAFIKSRYALADQLDHDYHINSYPTYLFFDESGKPLHKATGSLEVTPFIELAAAAKDPQKQYYTLLKDFHPGKIDTAEEKALARTFYWADKALAAKLADDYLRRLPDRQVGYPDNVYLLQQFQFDGNVVGFIGQYLDRHQQKPNAQLLLALNKLPRVKEIALKYIGHLPEDSLYREDNIRLMAAFTTGPQERGFKLFSEHAAKVDQVMGQKWYAQSQVVDIIKKLTNTPLLEAAKKDNQQPDFDAFRQTLTRDYGADVASRLAMDLNLDWLIYQVKEKKDTSLFSPMIDAYIKHYQADHFDIATANPDGVNNLCYTLIFLHSGTRAQLDTALSWMHAIVERKKSSALLDTYACLLYKKGEKELALKTEAEAIADAVQHKSPKAESDFRNTMEKMKRDEKIWLQRNIR